MEEYKEENKDTISTLKRTKTSCWSSGKHKLPCKSCSPSKKMKLKRLKKAETTNDYMILSPDHENVKITKININMKKTTVHKTSSRKVRKSRKFSIKRKLTALKNRKRR
jgi:hypothetical protein